MNDRDAMKVAIPHLGRGRWVAGSIAALVALAIVIWLVVAGFHGRHISRNADAITEPVTAPVNPGTSPSVTPVPAPRP